MTVGKLKREPKPPRQLYSKEDDGSFTAKSVWYCDECGLLSPSQDAAANCCRLPTCNVCKQMFETDNKYWLICEPCRRQKDYEKEQADWDKMPTVKYGDEPLYDGNGNYYISLDDYLCTHDEEDVDEYLEVCKRVTIGSQVSAVDVIDHVTEKLTENIELEYDIIFDKESEFLAAIQAFLDAQTYEIYEPLGSKIDVKMEMQ